MCRWGSCTRGDINHGDTVGDNVMMICAREVKDKLLFEMSEKNSVISDREIAETGKYSAEVH